MNKLNVGDTIKCSNEQELVEVFMELAKLDIITDFVYERDGEKGLWLEVVEVEPEKPLTLEEVKEKMCEEFCYYPFTCTSQEILDLHCKDCPLSNFEV